MPDDKDTLSTVEYLMTDVPLAPSIVNSIRYLLVSFAAQTQEEGGKMRGASLALGITMSVLVNVINDLAKPEYHHQVLDDFTKNAHDALKVLAMSHQPPQGNA